MFLLFKSCKTQTQQENNSKDQSLEDSIAEKKRKLIEKIKQENESNNAQSKDEAPVIDRLEKNN
ncbi:hypothetical protein EAH69_13550 [Faecalibacter macacae]|uniref:Uncharacterized protein n=2 Tax=Faecalibacter macacae TaxID=1859289 RepID=A0A3L9LZV6_9FLAO|nr:hypothetical protein EAH69_13550 [Faecalibacter macacae]